MDITIQVGINPEHQEDAARLYSIAFENKFVNIIGNYEEMTQLLKTSVNISRGISAISNDNELLGMAGFRLDNTPLINMRFKDFRKQYGLIKGIIKYLTVAILFSRNPDDKNQLLMDGIVVKEGNRGKGIGKKLFQELEQFAINNQLDSLKLDVIDENPKAKKLYEKIGFVPTKHQKVPNFIAKLINVSGVTTMVKKL